MSDLLPQFTLDERYMHAAISLGRRNIGQTGLNPSVGALIVKDSVVVGRGTTAVGGRPHAETQAIQAAGEAAKGATLYVTLEPCAHHGKTPPCVEAIISAGMSRVVVAVDDPDPRVDGAGYEALRKAGIEVTRGVLKAAAEKLHEAHLTKQALARPFFTLKLAVSRNMRLAAAAGERTAITSPETNRYVHMLRVQHGAILVGVGTVLADDPLLSVRLPGLEARSPKRIVLDPELKTPLNANIVKTADRIETYILTNQMGSQKAFELKQAGVQILPLLPVSEWLSAFGVASIFVEGGGETARRFLQQRIIHRFILLQNENLDLPCGVNLFPSVSSINNLNDHINMLDLEVIKDGYIFDNRQIIFEKIKKQKSR